MKRAGWRQFVGLSAVLGVDDANSLSDWLDLGLVRNPDREKALRIECRTQDAVHEVIYAPGLEGEILRQPAIRERDVIRVVGELVAREECNPVIVFCMRVDDTFSLNNQWIAGRRAVNRIVGHGPEINADLIRSVERRSAFHNAELSDDERSEEHTSELQSLMRISYAVFCLYKNIIQLLYCLTLLVI